MNELQTRPAPQKDFSVMEWSLLRDQATTLLKSKLLPDHLNSVEQVVVIGLQGKEMGIPLMAAVRGINVIKGKSSPSPQLKLALALRTKQVADLKVEVVGGRVNVAIKRKGFSDYVRASFGDSEAKALGLSGKDNYLKQPLTMYQWRAIDRVLNVAFADVVLGVADTDNLEDIDIPLEEDVVEIPVSPAVTQPSVTITASASQPIKAELFSDDETKIDLVADIMRMLTSMNNGKREEIAEHLRVITTWVDEKTGEELYMTPEDLPRYAKEKPTWIKKIHKGLKEVYQKS